MITAIRGGNTATAAYIDKANQNKSEYFKQSATLSKQPAYDELYAFWQECKLPNWDGYNAFEVQEVTLFKAHWLIEALPLGYPLPSVGAEPDGHLTLEWYANPYLTLSVSVSPEGILYYAALLGDHDARGSEFFWEDGADVPQTILELIKEVKG
jgi:hypothetical protein